MAKKVKPTKMEEKHKEEKKKRVKALKKKPSMLSREDTGSVVPLNEAAKVRPCLLAKLQAQSQREARSHSS
jgi:hypothetical protein